MDEARLGVYMAAEAADEALPKGKDSPVVDKAINGLSDLAWQVGGRRGMPGSTGVGMKRAISAHGGEACRDERVDLLREGRNSSRIPEGSSDLGLAICPRFLGKGWVRAQAGEAF